LALLQAGQIGTIPALNGKIAMRRGSNYLDATQDATFSRRRHGGASTFHADIPSAAKRFRLRRARNILLGLLVTAGLLAAGFGLRCLFNIEPESPWQYRLETVSDEAVPALLRQLAGMGESGVPVLVAALDSQRQNVAAGADRVLTESLLRWQERPDANNMKLQLALAEALAARVGQSGPSAQSRAAQLALHILQFMPDARSADNGRLIAACLRVLQSGPDLPDGLAENQIPGRIERRLMWQYGLHPQNNEAYTMANASGKAGRDSGGSSESDDNRPAAFDSDRDNIKQDSLAADDSQAEAAKNRQSGAPALLPDGFNGNQRLLPGDQSKDASRPLQSGERTAGAASQRVKTIKPPVDFSGVDTVALMRELHSLDRPTVEAAAAELARRKFTPLLLDLARRLFDPDNEVRLNLVRALPGMPGVDATPWLLWLARDGDAEVRLTALTLIATSGDPSLLEQVERMAQDDPDPRVQDRADRIGRQRTNQMR
jgi:hypothetical protein